MKRTRRRLSIVALSSVAALLVLACTGAPQTGAPPGGAGAQGGTAQNPANVAAEAAKEGSLVIYSTTDSASAEPLLREFRGLYPGLNVEYNDLNSTEAYSRFTSEEAAGSHSADFVWSSAMDLQMQLVTDGLALTYTSPEASGLPEGSVWKDQAWGTTLEPFVFAYNKRLLPADSLPQSHADLLRLLREKPDLFRDKVATYDPEKSGLGYLAHLEDSKLDSSWWDLAKAMGADGVKLYTSTGTMVERIQSGEHILGYDIIGSYVLPRSKQDPNLGMVMPNDFTLAFSRVAIISKSAPHPNAARLFLDYLLSKRGQETMAQQSLLHAIRPDAQGEATAAALSKELGPTLKPIKVSDQLLQGLQPTTRADWFRRWQDSQRG